jgi:hypothetical protein
MDAHGLVWMLATGMLDGVGVYGQLVNLAEENSVLELHCQHLLEHRPALRGCMELAVIDPLAQGHFESTSGARSHLKCHRQHPSIVRSLVFRRNIRPTLELTGGER